MFAGCQPEISGVDNQLSDYDVELTPTLTFGEKTLSPAITLENNKTSTPEATITPTQTMTPTPTPTPTPAVLIGAGDIAICGQDGDDQTAALISESGGVVFTAGDNVNGMGTLYEYENCFGPSWGQFKDRIHPSPGNHDYYSDPLENYYVYFGDSAGEAGKGYYSFDIANWHVIVLNSNCAYVPCGPSSEQVAWLKDDLAENPNRCSFATWHHPRWSSGLAGSSPWLFAFWDVLYEGGVDIVVNGHDHHYERFALMNPAGEQDTQAGIREFIAGTGGASRRGLLEVLPHSEKRIVGEYGVLKFTLHEFSYEWEFIGVDQVVLDSGSDSCSP